MTLQKQTAILVTVIAIAVFVGITEHSWGLGIIAFYVVLTYFKL